MLAFLFSCSLISTQAHSERLKDLADFQGVRNNQLIGYGLVVGLDGTGDQTTQSPFTLQSTLSMLQSLGITLPPGSFTQMQLKNVAAVVVTVVVRGRYGSIFIVVVVVVVVVASVNERIAVVITANLAPFAQIGQTLDVTVSAIGNAKTLRGGTLLMTPLKGADGQVYAMAQGNVVIGGATASANGSSATINQLNAGRISAGATVERLVSSDLAQNDLVNIELKTSDFSTANIIASTINSLYGKQIEFARE